MSFLVVVVSVVVGLAVLALAGLMLFVWPGWLRPSRAAEVVPPPTPPPPYPRALRSTSDGVYRGTFRAGDGHPVRSHGLAGRGRVQLVLAAEGLVLRRGGTNDLLVAEHELGGAQRHEDAVLLVRWRHGEVPLETHVELDDAGELPGWVASLEQMGRD